MRALIYLGLSVCLIAPVGLWPDDSTPPSLPSDTSSSGSSAPSAAPNDVSPKAEVAVPEEEPQAIHDSVDVHNQKAGRFLWGNFFLGALGGAILVGGAGILFGAASNNSGAIDSSRIGILCGAGAVGGGLLSVLLGATAEPAATPPDMKSSLPNEENLQAELPSNRLSLKLQF